ncbi:uncharacterized protein TRUGW13939_08612 [Talaromyces rugulosus]|uniref:ER-bound oxygenase mpaB/mpaB'/Rubber oxygenase catalytic domain-containing protein n=1 Tax=Talaromyces rugulosus TaxID=121627 RepID=A0A7H8R501_TALRU|nr:uncharacterized protein TRUGW13939_08612 [Talaromyces rugulosus]QKX61464.1 hypothetical protein TRUGW13939_08612 [Talaromyces rugulosus]
MSAVIEKSQNVSSSPGWDEKTVNEASESTKIDQELLDALDKPKEILKIVQEGLLLAGGAVAILLQVANPGVAKGVDQHSNFSYRPLDRLRTTMTYVYCMAFGSQSEKAIIIDMVHKAHAPVQGADYSADDPGLQTWVAATLYAVGVDMYQRIFGELDRETAETIYKEYAILAVSLRVPPEMWPKDRAAFWEYWNEQIETVEISQHAKNVAKDLLYNKNAPLHVWASLPLVRLITAEMLPKRIRDEYGLKTTKARRATYKFALGFAKMTYPALPKFIRTYPKRYYMKDMRRRMQKATS